MAKELKDEAPATAAKTDGAASAPVKASLRERITLEVPNQRLRALLLEIVDLTEKK